MRTMRQFDAKSRAENNYCDDLIIFAIDGWMIIDIYPTKSVPANGCTWVHVHDDFEIIRLFDGRLIID